VATTSDAPSVHPLGFAAGVGAAFAATLGTVLHFALPVAPTPLLLGGAFALGAGVGGAWVRVRRPTLADD
jgi:hypothetical protein